MADNKKNDTKTTTSDHDTSDNTDNESPYIPTPELHPEDFDPDEEVTPKNVQAPIDDEDKLKQDNVLQADHIRLGFPANEVPRTDEERKAMEEAGLIDKPEK